MAARKGRCYVYLVSEGATPLYVGKGTGRRSVASAKKHGGTASILEAELTDDAAFIAERKWIAELLPQNNICSGGNGGRTRSKRSRRRSKEEIEIERVGSQVYCARFLLTKLDDGNCEKWGVSKVDLSRLREVAHG